MDTDLRNFKMTKRLKDPQNIIKLQLNKPKNWNWELSTLNTSQNIALPIIQLYDNKKNLLVQTSPYERKSWNSENFNQIPKRTSSYNHLNTSDRIKIREVLLKKSNSDLLKREENILQKSKIKNDLLNNNVVPIGEISRTNNNDLVQNKNLFLKKSNTISAPNKQNYKLQRSFKRTSLRDIPTILEENLLKRNCESENKNSAKSCHQSFPQVIKRSESVTPKVG